MRTLGLVAVGRFSLTACGGSDTSDDSGTGGAKPGSGGTTASGGSSGTGGAATTGGSTSSGGAGTGGTAGASSGTGGTGGQVVAPTSDWVDVTNDFASAGSMDSSLIAASPYADLIVVNIWQQGLWGSTNGGDNWTKMGTGTSVANGAVDIIWDPEDSTQFWESGMYGPAAYRINDSGTSVTGLGDIQHVDTMGVDLTDPERKTLVAGGHEQKRKLYKSTDAGATWGEIGLALPEDSHFSSYPIVLDANTYLVGCAGWGDGTAGIHKTTDGGTSFNQVSTEGAAGRPLVASDGAIYWSTIWGSGFVRSTDNGDSFQRIVSGNALVQLMPLELPDGRLVTASKTNLMLSVDQGANWTPLGDALPYELTAGVGYSTFTYSTFRKAFYIVKNQGRQIMRYGFDWETE